MSCFSQAAKVLSLSSKELKVALTCMLFFLSFLFTGSVLDNGNSYTSGRHASLLAATSASRQPGLTGNGLVEATQVSSYYITTYDTVVTVTNTLARPTNRFANALVTT